MKILKNIIFAILAIIALFFIVAIFVPRDYAVEREAIVKMPIAQVFDYVKMLRNQDNYSKWANIDPTMEKTFRGSDGTVGFVSAWDSDHKDVGKGEQEIMKILEGERIDFELRFYEPWEATDNAYMVTESLGRNETLVKWGFFGKMDYPSNMMLLFMDMDDMLGPDLEEGLDNLKTILEKK